MLKRFPSENGKKKLTIISSFGHFSGVQMNNRKARKTSKGQEQQVLTGCGNSCLNTGYSEVNLLRGERVAV